MSPVDREIVRRKLTRIAENLALLEPFRGATLDEYRRDVYRRKAVERLLQEIVEAAVDANSHLLVALGAGAPTDLYSSFLGLADHGVLESALAQSLAPSAGLRNRLVHDYERIDDALVLAGLGRALELYPRFVAALTRYLDA